MPRIPREVTEHSLDILPDTKPIKQRLCHFDDEKWMAIEEDVTEPPNYMKLSRKIIQQKDNSTNLSSYNPVVHEISTDFKPFLITAKIVLSLTVTIISYIKVRGIKYIGV
jgi:hypothetical protein